MNAYRGWPVLGRFIPLFLAWACGCASLQARVEYKSANIVAIGNNHELSHEQSASQQIALGNQFTDKELAPASLKSYSTKTLKLLLESLDSVSFYTYGEQRYVAMQERVFDELAARDSQTPENIQDMFQRYLAARLFDKARFFRARFPNVKLWNVPDIIELKELSVQSHRVYDISSDSRTATVKYLPIETGPKIVIAAMTECPITAEALKYIESDKDLRQALQASGIMLTIRFEPGGVAYRNSLTTVARTYVAYTAKDWPGIDFSKSPTFYFLKDGNILHHFFGWGSVEKDVWNFNKGLEQIGLKKS